MLQSIIAVIFSSVLFSSMSWATGGGGVVVDGGGGGVEINGQVYLSDLYEMGNHKHPEILTEEVDAVLYESLRQNEGFSTVSDLTLKVLTRKLSDILAMDPVLGSAVAEAIRLMNWNFTSSALIQTDDTKLCPVDVTVIQLAVRQGNVVNVSQKVFEQMDVYNQAALIVHEAVHAVAPSDLGSSCHRRRVVASLFKKSFIRSTTNDFKRQYLKGFPNRFEAIETRKYLRSGPYSLTSFLLKKTKQSLPPDVLHPELERSQVLPYLFPFAEVWPMVEGQGSEEVSVYALNERDLCDGREGQTFFVIIDYMSMQLLPQWSAQGEFLSTFQWGLSVKSYTKLWVGTGEGRRCTEDERRNLKSLSLWRDTFRDVF